MSGPLDVLILDEPGSRRTELLERFQAHGMRAEATASLDTVQHQLQRHPPRLLLVCLAAIDDLERIGALKRQLGNARLYAIMEPDSSESLIRRCLGMGVDRCFAYPLDVAALCRELSESTEGR